MVVDKELVKVPDARLRTPCTPVPADIDLEELKDISVQMLEAMYAHKGVGLAAPQVGLDMRIFVADVESDQTDKKFSPDKGEPLVFVNPEILDRRGIQYSRAGCLSVPGHVCTVARSASVVVRDMFGTHEYFGLAAAVIQHEIDHLDGRLMIDYKPGIS